MNNALLQAHVQAFIGDNLGADLHRLLLKGSPFPGVSARELVEQIASKKKALKKLPSLTGVQNIYFPGKLPLEQCSSEACAVYKAGIAAADTVFDLTGGFGIDSLYFSKRAKQVVYCETDRELAAIAAHNFRQLGAGNIIAHAVDGIQWLQETGRKADLIFIDPSRRSTAKRRVFFLADCSPNVVLHRDLLLSNCAKLLIKTSPLLDLQAGLRELGPVREIHVVALRNEVRELLWLMEDNYHGPVLIKAIDLNDGHAGEFSFYHDEEKEHKLHLSAPLGYLYEPNAAIMKSGGFTTLGAQLGLPKLHEHSHLYTSENLLEFPGRRFGILRIMPYSGKTLKSWQDKKANVSTRNFPAPVAAIRKKFRIQDGGNSYLFFTKGPENNLIVIECEKI